MDAGAGAGSGNASGGGASACCYYALLGIRKNASATDIRAAAELVAARCSTLLSIPLVTTCVQSADQNNKKEQFEATGRCGHLLPRAAGRS